MLVLVAAGIAIVEDAEFCAPVLEAGTTTVEKVELGASACVVGTEETEATTNELETGTTEEIEDEIASADEVLSTLDDCTTADEVAGVEEDAPEADDTDPEADAPPGPETLVVRSPLSTYTPLK